MSNFLCASCKDFSDKFSVETGDIILGIKKLTDGYQLIVNKLETVQEGTKLLGSTGGRHTARILKGDIFDRVVEKLGVKDAKFLTEKQTLSSKTLMPKLAGRFSYIIN